VWALAIKVVFQSGIESILLTCTNKWIPSFVFKIDSIKKYFSFAGNMLLAGLLSSVTKNLDRIIVGKIFNATTLGFFDRSKNYNGLIQQNLAATFTKVFFPYYSLYQNDKNTFIRAYRKSIRSVAFIVVPIYFGIIAIAEPLIVILITEKWIFTAKLLKILALSGFTYPLSALMVNAIASQGRADIFLLLDIIKTTIYIISILIGSTMGIFGLTWAATTASFINFYVNLYAVKKLTKIKIYSQIKDMSFPVIASLCMLIILIIMEINLRVDALTKLIIVVSTGAAIYSVGTMLFNRPMVREMKKLIVKVVEWKKDI
jgi:O-antigen/teichoic acid export membrane protein